MDCIFCNISEGKIPCAKIWEDENFLAFLDINPVNPGHTLVIPKVHVDHLFALSEPTYSGLFQVAKKLSKPLQKAMNAKRIGIVVEGFLVHHAHIHLVPINAGNELDFRRARPASPQELETAAAKIRRAL